MEPDTFAPPEPTPAPAPAPAVDSAPAVESGTLETEESPVATEAVHTIEHRSFARDSAEQPMPSTVIGG